MLATDPRLERSFSFGAFADAHYAEGLVVENRFCGESLERVSECADTFNALALPMAVNLGDLLDCTDDRERAVRSADQMRRVLERFTGRWRHVLGNHDAATFPKMEFLDRIGARDRRRCYSFEAGGRHFVVLDGNYTTAGVEYEGKNFDWPDSLIPQPQIDWLAADLAAARGRPIVVLTHENLDDETGPHGVKNAPAVRAALAEAGTVLAVLQGHRHEGLRRVIAGIPYIGLKAVVTGSGPDCTAYAVVTLGPGARVALEGFGLEPDYAFDPRAEVSP